VCVCVCVCVKVFSKTFGTRVEEYFNSILLSTKVKIKLDSDNLLYNKD
jgi:hypothetical protein